MMIKNPIEQILKILIFHRFLVRESLKIPCTEQKLPKMAQKLEIFVFTKSLLLRQIGKRPNPPSGPVQIWIFFKVYDLYFRIGLCNSAKKVDNQVILASKVGGGIPQVWTPPMFS